MAIFNMKPLDSVDAIKELGEHAFLKYGDQLEMERLVKNCEHSDISIWYDPGTHLMQLRHADGKCSEPLYAFEKTLYGMNTILGLLPQNAKRADNTRLTQLEERMTKLERVLTVNSIESRTIAGEDSLKEQIQKLGDRAKAIGNELITYRNAPTYIRHIRSINPMVKTSPRIFTASDAYRTQRRHHNNKWFFNNDEIDDLEKFIAHDEEIYRKTFSQS